MDKIKLNANHQRSVSSSIRLVENLINEIEWEIDEARQNVLTKINHEVGNIDVEHVRTVIVKVRSYIRYLSVKYDLQPSELFLDRIVNSRKSSMWVVLCDATSSKLKGYGEFPKEYAREFDSDMEHLQRLVAII